MGPVSRAVVQALAGSHKRAGGQQSRAEVQALLKPRHLPTGLFLREDLDRNFSMHVDEAAHTGRDEAWSQTGHTRQGEMRQGHTEAGDRMRVMSARESEQASSEGTARRIGLEPGPGHSKPFG